MDFDIVIKESEIDFDIAIKESQIDFDIVIKQSTKSKNQKQNNENSNFLNFENLKISKSQVQLVKAGAPPSGPQP